MRGAHLAVGLALVLLLQTVVATATTETSDTLTIVKEDESVTNVDIAVMLSQQTPAPADAVVISRDDEFADALASGLLQQQGPLLLVPTAGPVPDSVTQEIAAVGASKAIILGGEAAVSAAVADELRALGLEVERQAGGSRFDTAIAIAQAGAPSPDVVMLARAFPAPGAADPTQAFADSLAAGGVSARHGWPIVLTQTDELTGVTRDYLAASGASRVMVLGGTAAISDAVFDAAVAVVGDGVRVAGETRFETAIEIAKVGGDDTAADVAQVIMVEGVDAGATAFAQGLIRPDPWATGFASARRALVFDAPILLTAAGDLPVPTREFLAPGISGDPAMAPLITCTIAGPVCEQTRVAARRAPAFEVTFTPQPGTTVPPGQEISIDLGGYAGEAMISGSCLDAPFTHRSGGVVTATVAATAAVGPCELAVDGVTLADGTVQDEQVRYGVSQDALRQATTIGQIDLGVGGLCGLAVDTVRDRMYAIDCSTSVVHRFGLDGRPLVPAAVEYPGGGSNDIDIDMITTATRIGGVTIPAGSLLLVNGEVTSLYVLDPADGTVLVGPLPSGASGETVGVAWDGPFDEVVEVSWTTDMVQRQRASDLSVVDSFPVAPPDGPRPYDIFFGDVEVACDSSLLLVSSAEPTVRHLSPHGGTAVDYETGAAITDQSASIALDDQTGLAYVATNSDGLVFVVDGLPTAAPC